MEVDPYALAGGRGVAVTRAVRTTVAHGELLVTFTPRSARRATISALEIKPVARQ